MTSLQPTFALVRAIGGSIRIVGHEDAMNSVDVVQKQLEAYNACNLDAFLACYAPGAVIVDGEGREMCRGMVRLREVYGPMFRDNPHQFAIVLSRIAAGTYVVDDEEIEGRADNIRRRAVLMYRVQDGLIQHVTVIRA
jgi:hypothetical protein